MSDLLCSTYRVFTRDRRTKRLVYDYTDRVIDGTFDCRLSRTSRAFTAVAIEEGCEIAKPRPWLDEWVIQRDGDQSKIVWFGPVRKATADMARNELRVEARDPSEWWNRKQIVRAALSLENVDASVAWAAVRSDQERGDPSGLAVGSTEPVGRLVSIQADKFADTFPILDSLDDVAWTVKAGQLYGPGATTDGPNPFGVRLDASVDWVSETGRSGPVIICDGENVATKVFTRGRTGEYGQWPPEGTAAPDEGWHIPDVIRRDDLFDSVELNAAAREIWERNRTTPVFLASSSGSLRKGSPLCFDDLLAGRRYTVTTGDPTLPVVTVELSNMVVDFEARQVGGVVALWEDRVAVDFAPVGVPYETVDLSF